MMGTIRGFAWPPAAIRASVGIPLTARAAGYTRERMAAGCGGA